MRLFFALNFTPETKARLAALRDELRGKSAGGNFSADENLHLTLVFLGECDSLQLAAAKTALDSLRVTPVEIKLDSLGRFRRDGDIWWVGLAENRELLALQRDLSNKLISAGFKLEKRKYSPHITLAREVITGAEPWKIEPLCETVRAVDLMRSERVRGKLTYTAIHSKETGVLAYEKN